MTYRKEIYCLIGIVLTLTGCSGSKKTFNAASIPTIHPTKKLNLENVSIQTHTYTTKQEAEKLFGPLGRNLFKNKKTLYPIQITVKNNSAHTITLSPEDISLVQVKNQSAITKIINQRLHIPAIPTILGGFATTTAFSIGFAASWLARFGIGIFTCYVGLLATPLITLGYAGYQSIREHREQKKIFQKINGELNNYMLIDCCQIDPTQEITKLIFVNKKDYNPNFTIAIRDNQGKALVFDFSEPKNIQAMK